MFVSFLLHFTVKIIKKKIKIRLIILLFYYLFFLLLLITLSPLSLPPFLCFSLPAFLLSVSLLSFYSCTCNFMFSYCAFYLTHSPSFFILSFHPILQLPQNLNMLTDIIHSCWGACILPDPGTTDLESDPGSESGAKINL